MLLEGREKAMVRLSEMPEKVSTRMLVVAMVLLNGNVRQSRRKWQDMNSGVRVRNIKNKSSLWLTRLIIDIWTSDVPHKSLSRDFKRHLKSMSFPIKSETVLDSAQRLFGPSAPLRQILCK